MLELKLRLLLAGPSNPYASPAAAASDDPVVRNSAEHAVRRVRIAAAIGVLAPMSAYARFVSDGMWHAKWQGEMGGFFVVGAVFGAVAIAATFAAGWFLAYPVLRAAATGVRHLFSRHVSDRQWQHATDNALWTLPYAAGLGVVAWLVYSFVSSGGWPFDFAFGALGHMIAAWFCLTLIVHWISVSRTAKLDRSERTKNG